MVRYAGSIVGVVVVAALAAPAWAGGEGFADEEEEHAGPKYLGYVRDRRGEGIVDAKVTVELKVGTVILRSDQDGQFKVSGFGPNVDPQDVKFSCSKEGLKEFAISKQVTGEGATAVVEVNCILGPP
jgi:hypothetical protein